MGWVGGWVGGWERDLHDGVPHPHFGKFGDVVRDWVVNIHPAFVNQGEKGGGGDGFGLGEDAEDGVLE